MTGERIIRLEGRNEKVKYFRMTEIHWKNKNH